MQQHQINAAGEAFAREFSLALAMSSASPGIQTQADARWVAASFQANSMMQPINSQAERPMVPPPVLANATSQQHFLAAATASAQMSRSSSRSSASEDLRDPLVQHQRHSATQSRLEDLPGGVGGASDLEDLVDCFRESVEQNLRRSRDRSASRSSSCSTATSRSSSAQCELVTALQNHLKSAVAAAAAAATVAAAANSASHRHNINQINNLSPIERCQQATTSGQVRHHSNPPSRDYTPTLRESSPIPLDLKILPEYEMWHDDDDDDELSMSSSRSQDVQHTETVQTTTASNDAIKGPSGGGPSDFSLAPNTCNMAATTLLAAQPPPQPPTTTSSSATGHQTSGTGGGAAGGHHIKQRRLYKCRHCSFETDKKIENWQHIRIHMRPEKLLSCGSCLFVTEYKHHLEYHQRNHTGYKPFKCEHCDYTCVNKSMLNSHMKSHSSVYQYQCGDCKYATKYVHSLKMHLRKYNHQPAAFMIDIFGRKRGPKPGSGRKQQQLKQQRELQQAQQQQQQQSNSGSATAGVTATTTTKTTTANGKAKKQSAARQQQQQQQCILDLRVDSKLAAR